MPCRVLRVAWAVLAGALLASRAASVPFVFEARGEETQSPSFATGSMEVDLSLSELRALEPTVGAPDPLGASIRAEVAWRNAFSDDGGERVYALDPAYTASFERLLLEVQTLEGNPASLELVLVDSDGWRGCVAEPADCDRRTIELSAPGGGFGPGVAARGVRLSSANPGQGVEVLVPEPASGLLLLGGLLPLAAPRRRGATRLRSGRPAAEGA